LVATVATGTCDASAPSLFVFTAAWARQARHHGRAPALAWLWLGGAGRMPWPLMAAECGGRRQRRSGTTLFL